LAFNPMLVSDLRHFLDERGSIAIPDGPGRALAEQLAAIVAYATSEPMDEVQEGVPCRRRPARRPCGGIIGAYANPETAQVIWRCPKCGDRGVISGWENTLWDCREGGPFQ
jgi:hypothetical protein